jgi:hypothetical protein
MVKLEVESRKVKSNVESILLKSYGDILKAIKEEYLAN